MSLQVLSINNNSTPNTLLLIPYELQYNLSALLGNYILPLKESKGKVHVGVIPQLAKKKMSKPEFVSFWRDVVEYCEVQGINNIGVVSSDIMKFAVEKWGDVFEEQDFADAACIALWGIQNFKSREVTSEKKE